MPCSNVSPVIMSISRPRCVDMSARNWGGSCVTDSLIDVHCILTVEKLRQKAEATVLVSGGKIYADAVDQDMYAAIDLLADRAGSVWKKHKEKPHRSSRRKKPEDTLVIEIATAAMRLIHQSAVCQDPERAWRCHMLEDLDFYCIDNIPAALLKPFISHTVRSPEPARAAPSQSGWTRAIDPARSRRVPTLVQELRRAGIACKCCSCSTHDDALLNRYGRDASQAPLSSDGVSLREAIRRGTQAPGASDRCR